MVVGQSEASAERHDQFAGQARNDTGWLVGGDGGTACGLEKPRGKSACGLLTREFQQNDKHCAQELRLR